jgi:D-alanine-D-alanine ligase-like ATP-grasp enzyme
LGAPGRNLAPRLDLLRSIGPLYAWRMNSHRRAARALPLDGRRAGYVERWTDAARQLGAEATDLSRGFIELRWGDVRTMVWNHWVPLDDVVTLKLALEKPLVHQILMAGGLPVPEHALFHVDDPAPALEFLKRSGGACVVKPVDREGGSLTTSGVCTPDHLRRARLRARRLSDRAMIERQVEGDNYRFLFLDGQLLDVVRRRAPRVVGDGRSTVRELMAAENGKRYEAAGGAPTWELVAELDTVLTLEQAGMTLGTVPAAGQSVVIKNVVNANGPENNESALDEVGDELVADAARAAELLGVRLAGVDLITPDCRRSLAAAGGVVLEVNTTPGLHYHYEVNNPEKSVPVLVPILRALFEHAAARAPELELPASAAPA